MKNLFALAIAATSIISPLFTASALAAPSRNDVYVGRDNIGSDPDPTCGSTCSGSTTAVTADSDRPPTNPGPRPRGSPPHAPNVKHVTEAAPTNP